MVYENPVGQGGHCMQPVTWVGRWKFLRCWRRVWSCERHTDELVGVRFPSSGEHRYAACKTERVSAVWDLLVTVTWRTRQCPEVAG
jgi:hypothetical protein